MRIYQTNETLLRHALTGNGWFSGVSGLACLFASEPIAKFLFAKDFSLLGLSPSNIIIEVGIGLLVFAGLVFFTARQTMLSLSRAKFISILDMLWVGGSAILLVVYSEYFSSGGFAAVLVVAAIVFIFAIDQLLGVVLTYQGESEVSASTQGDRLTLRASRFTKASPERVWEVMSHQESYADVAENISKVEVLQGKGEGMIRKCYDHKGESWQETCSRWDEGRAFAFRVHTEAKDYPYPIAQLAGEWSLSPCPQGTQIMMVFQVQAKPGLVNRLLFNMMAAPFAGICDRLLSKWVHIMENQTTFQVGTSMQAIPAAQSA